MTEHSQTVKNDYFSRAIKWLQHEIIVDARGDRARESDSQPSSLFWLGRLSPEIDVSNVDDDRFERLAPCAIGLRIRPSQAGPWSFGVSATFVVWSKPERGGTWQKSGPISVKREITVEADLVTSRTLSEPLKQAIVRETGREDLAAAIDISLETRDGRQELVIQLVNTSESNEKAPQDRNLYEACLEVGGLTTTPFELEGLEDAFRYDRELPAIGLNAAVLDRGGRIATSDVPEATRFRPTFVPPGIDEATLSFVRLAEDPVQTATLLHAAHKAWGLVHWSEQSLSERAARERWSSEMVEAAAAGRTAFWEENARLEQGLRLLAEEEELRRAFKLMNEAMEISANGRYHGWRAFQFGFLVANLASLMEPSEAEIADIVWFATGGGKTETYLGLLVTAMLLDRMRGKLSGITAWSRFPLRMLSLQQTQRFADAIAAAELVRRRYLIGGDTFSLGFFVGQGATPNEFKADPKEDEPNAYDDESNKRFLILDRCPFCRNTSVDIAFDLETWTLQHRCTAPNCEWPEQALPFYIVDQEIYRFLPTVVVGTLDKAASIGMQAAMRGFIGNPLGLCTGKGHGFTYAPRSSRPSGCLVPDCAHAVTPISKDPRFAPSLRLQDELHLLRDSLGAVDAHYEALYDHLSAATSERKPKILGSSATLAGYEHQVDTLYGRRARVFPQPGPAPGVGFWTSDSGQLMRHYIALAPRGATVEHAVDRILTVLQRSIRRLLSDPEVTCPEIGIPVAMAGEIVDLYGTDVVYGNTLRDLDAMTRSAETQVLVEGKVTQASLTGRTDFEEVRQTLARLEKPPAQFDERLHLIMASSMMSHGVDIDRLNVMTMVGFPLGTAEFIQATARVGRKYPGLVILVPKMGRERDAGIYRTFPKFVEHADRLVEPIPITRRSRRVLQRTLPGMELARILMLEEPAAGKSLVMARALKQFRADENFDPDAEAEALMEALGLIGELNEALRKDVAEWVDVFMRNINDPPADVRFSSEASPGSGPMRSLRDVEESVTVYGKEDLR
ncbi:helicase C-terminal domain-containing protein [Rhodanobacter sp. PCA2]|uniref:helicase C-terminal domain-containing protein n=1 Tax=Rhodanobacter sp. PCA2 TaxID=2006117 RepID=UPI0015E6DEBA|nr:helicase C-terminal domain-containing protein [Rhodanobacter sp. PCA2]MBA2080080.1 DNA helicase [Rhodanobacter sp. PCA2]